MTTEEIERGIASYAKHRQVLRDVIAAHGGRLSQDEFDQSFVVASSACMR